MAVNLLAPIMAWWGLLAIPVILLYLAGRRPRRVVVSAVMFWAGMRGAMRAEGGWWRVRRWVSLFLQLLVLACLVGALLDPVLPGGGGGTVFVLDGSASMRTGDPSRFERARAALAGELLRSRGSPAAVIFAGDAPRILTGWTTVADPGVLDGLEPSRVSRDPSEALALAGALAGERRARVVLFTDRVWDGRAPAEWPPGIAIRDFGGKSGGGGISHFSARRSPVVPEEVWIRAEALGGNGTMEILRDGVVVDARPAPGGYDAYFHEPGSARFEARFTPSGGDDLAADNSHTIAVAPPGRVEAVVVGEADPFLDAALGAVPGVDVVRVGAGTPLRFGDATKLWIFQGSRPPPDFQYKGLVLVNPDGDGFWGKRIGEMNDPVVTDADEADPVLHGSGFARIALGAASLFEPAAGARVYASSAGRPLIFGDWSRTPRWVVFAFDPAAGDMVNRAAYPVVIGNLVDAMREGREIQDSGATAALARNEPVAVDAAGGDGGPAPAGLWWILAALAAALLVVEWALFQKGATE